MATSSNTDQVTYSKASLHRNINFRVHKPTLRLLALVLGVFLLLSIASSAAQSAGPNVRVTVDQGSNYLSADQLAGGTYTDAVLQRCGVDRRPQNEPTLAIDPRNNTVWASGANEYCTVPTAGDAWAGFYRSITAGAQRDPVMGFDGQGNLFYMGNNFSRGIENGVSGTTRNNIGTIWVATYAPTNPTDSSTDGSKYVRTVILATNTFGQGQFNDKTSLAVDPVTGNIYAAWSDFHAAGCNQILFSRSTNHGVTFSAPLKISSGICGNQGPSIAIGPSGQVYVGWEAFTGGTFGQGRNAVVGATLVSSTNYGQTFSKARVVQTYTPFTSGQFSGSGSRECGDAPFNCPTGFTFPRFDLANPYLAFDLVHNALVLAFQAALNSGQGQIEYIVSTDSGTSFSSPALLAPSSSGHQFFPFVTASNGRLHAIWYDSRGDSAYSPTRPPCNSPTGQTSACVNVRYAESTDGGASWGASVQVTSTPTNPNFEQFSGRTVPFFGDYITVAAQGDTVGATWTDQRDTVAASDTSADNDGADVAGDPETGGICTSTLTACFDATGGLDQNIYSAAIAPQ